VGGCLRGFLATEKGLPSHDTFSRLIRLLDPGQGQVQDWRWVRPTSATMAPLRGPAPWVAVTKDGRTVMPGRAVSA
jgi:hypothetical protein